MCLLHSVFDKSAWLREREIAEPWPVAGLPDTVHVDNGADFRSRAFKRGCQDAGIAIEWRPRAQVWLTLGVGPSAVLRPFEVEAPGGARSAFDGVFVGTALGVLFEQRAPVHVKALQKNGTP